MVMKHGVKVEPRMDFSVIRETLTRMGIVNKTKKIIWPTSYIYFDSISEEYYICHFKELLSMFDEVPDILDEKDTDRRNSICTLLELWGMIEIIDRGAYQETIKEPIFTLTAKEKRESEYTIKHKFNSFAKLTELRESKV